MCTYTHIYSYISGETRRQVFRINADFTGAVPKVVPLVRIYAFRIVRRSAAGRDFDIRRCRGARRRLILLLRCKILPNVLISCEKLAVGGFFSSSLAIFMRRYWLKGRFY